jgi:hypothetical protein
MITGSFTETLSQSPIPLRLDDNDGQDDEMGVGAINNFNNSSLHHHRWDSMPINLDRKSRSTTMLWNMDILFDKHFCFNIRYFWIIFGK